MNLGVNYRKGGPLFKERTARIKDVEMIYIYIIGNYLDKLKSKKRGGPVWEKPPLQKVVWNGYQVPDHDLKKLYHD